MKYEALFSPITIGNVTIKNRVVMTPCSCTGYESPEGYITEQEKAYHAARALGGVGLIDAGTVTVTKLHADRRTVGPKMLNSTYYRGLTELADTIHYFGAKVFVQMSTGQGRQVFSKKTWVDPSLDVISASPVPYHREKSNYPPKATRWHARRGLSWAAAGADDGLMPREATIEEIEETENSVAAAVPVFKSLGYDGVEIHSSHGYFAFSFLSPRLNLRTDKYGGSVENRLRFFLNMIRKSRRAVGDDFVIGCRFSLDEHILGGYGFDFAKVIAQEVEKAGVNYILLSDGCHEAYKYYIPDESGTMLDRAGELKKVIKIPIITPSVHDPDMAEAAIRDGKTDMIGLARGLIAEPNWVNKVARGEPIVECGRCNSGCLIRIHKALPVKCVANPESGYEQYNPKYQIREPKRKLPPCQVACPIGQNIAGYIEAIYDGKLKKAMEIIRDTNPLPAILGRVCTHPCETVCNRGKVDEPVAICSLKRFVVDNEMTVDAGEVMPVARTKSDRVAVIGSGPAGLAAAHDLVKIGYDVTIFEALPVAGGMLASRIPEERLPKKVLQAEIERIKKLGVEIKLNSPIGKTGLTLRNLRKQGYKAIFLATGTTMSTKSGGPREEFDDIDATVTGKIKVEPASLATNITGIFAGGDVVTGSATVVEAVAAGKRAAKSIDYYLRGELLPPEAESLPAVTFEELRCGKVEKRNRGTMFPRPLREKSKIFKEVNREIEREAAVEEADRCFDCSVCVQIQL